MILGVEQLRKSKTRSIMKWYENEGDYSPKDKNLQGWTFAQNDGIAPHGGVAQATRHQRPQ